METEIFNFQEKSKSEKFIRPDDGLGMKLTFGTPYWQVNPVGQINRINILQGYYTRVCSVERIIQAG